MVKWIRIAFLASICLIGVSETADAQGVASPGAANDGWEFAVYAVLAWVPLGIDIAVDAPPTDGSSGESGEIVDGRFDGAFFGGSMRPTARGGSRATVSGLLLAATARSDPFLSST